MTRKHLLAVALLAAGAISSASAEPVAYTVDCARGQTIGRHWRVATRAGR
jgi:hypothetical protein